eukprot:CAMPEP_0185756880 /NCGR_PEP_ID=MMETSP1174-20130828/15269_1 /TAXON_ID=35687 /ORGANISM="Dictyocha speculum, Strain CCMP1381" /LENGTH=96 /DNA_ID=CAMNT_0028436021 /DNA_START=253 /DNA_END=543 /DNA_ORIENTATION=+
MALQSSSLSKLALQLLPLSTLALQSLPLSKLALQSSSLSNWLFRGLLRVWVITSSSAESSLSDSASTMLTTWAGGRSSGGESESLVTFELSSDSFP